MICLCIIDRAAAGLENPIKAYDINYISNVQPKANTSGQQSQIPCAGESKSCAPAVISLQQLKMSRSFSFLWPLILSHSLSTWNTHIAARQAWIHVPWIYFIFLIAGREKERERETTLFQFWRNGAGGKKNHIHSSTWKIETTQHNTEK